MRDQSPSSAQRARQLLDAWNQEDLSALEAESPAEPNPSTVDTEEQERLELLDSITSQMRQSMFRKPLDADASQSIETYVRLLEHLATSGQHAPIRSEKLSFLPYSQPERRTSPCR